MPFLTMMHALFALQRTFRDAEFNMSEDTLTITIPVSGTNAELFRQGRQMFSR